MGHLDNTERVIEMRLTSVGRKRLAEGKGIDITQFALADDEIDYGLWQDGEEVPEEDRKAIIENLPVFEAFKDEEQSMRYKLLAFENSSDKIPQISTPKNIQVKSSSKSFSPSTVFDEEPSGLDEGIGYSLFLSKSDVVNVVATEEVENQNATVPSAYEDEAFGTLAAIGNEFQINKKAAVKTDQQVVLTVVGNETGLSSQVTLNVKA